MASLLEIKNKINATKSTKKITKAMQLVAASKMKSFQRTATSVRAYTQALLGSLALCGRTLNDTDVASVRKEGKVLFLLLTSDKGLCGAMNAKLIRTLFKSSVWNETPENERLLVTVGRKSREAARAAGIPVADSFDGLKEKLETVDALGVIDAVMRRWNSGEVKRVIMIAPEYVNPFVFHVRERDYLPLRTQTIASLLADEQAQENEDAPAKEKTVQEAAFFEPTQDAVVERIAQQVVESLFIEAFFELKATEYSSRMVAMKKATEAADDKIKELTNAFNKARQSAITQQLSELAAANEAMSSEHMYETFEV